MSLRRSQGAMRAHGPRLVEVHPVAPTKDTREGRTAEGKFTTGNRAGADRAWRTAVGKLLGGRAAADATMRQVAKDAWRLNGAILRSLASDGPIVRVNVASLSMSAAVEAYWSSVALAEGLSTPAGQAASERARIFGTRVERLSVVVLDLASKLASAKENAPNVPALREAMRRVEAMRSHRVEVDAGDASEAGP